MNSFGNMIRGMTNRLDNKRGNAGGGYRGGNTSVAPSGYSGRSNQMSGGGSARPSGGLSGNSIVDYFEKKSADRYRTNMRDPRLVTQYTNMYGQEAYNNLVNANKPTPPTPPRGINPGRGNNGRGNAAGQEPTEYMLDKNGQPVPRQFDVPDKYKDNGRGGVDKLEWQEHKYNDETGEYELTGQERWSPYNSNTAPSSAIGGGNSYNQSGASRYFDNLNGGSKTNPQYRM